MASQPLFHPAVQFRSRAIPASRKLHRHNPDQPKFPAPVRLALVIGLALASWSPVLLFI